MASSFFPQHFTQNIVNVGWGGLWLEIFVRTRIAGGLAWPVNTTVPLYGGPFELGRAQISIPKAGAIGVPPNPSPNPSAKEVLAYFDAFTLKRLTAFPAHTPVPETDETSGGLGWTLRPPVYPAGWTYPSIAGHNTWEAYNSWHWWSHQIIYNPFTFPVPNATNILTKGYATYEEAAQGKIDWIAFMVAGGATGSMLTAAQQVFIEPGIPGGAVGRGQWHYFRLAGGMFPNLPEGNPARDRVEFVISNPPQPSSNNEVEFYQVRARLLRIERDPPQWPPYPEWETLSDSRVTRSYADIAGAQTITVKIDRKEETVLLVPSDGKGTAPAEVSVAGEKVPHEPPAFPEDVIVG